MGGSLTRPEGPPPGEERSYAKQIYVEIVHNYYSFASRLSSLLGAAPTSPEVFRREQWVRISDEKIDAPKPGYALVVDPATATNGTIRVRMRVLNRTILENVWFELEAVCGATHAAASAAADIATEYAIEATKAMLLSEPKAFTISLTTREWRSDDDDEKLRKLVEDNGGSSWDRVVVGGEKRPYGRATFREPGVRRAYDAKDALLSDPLVEGVSAGGDYWLLFA